MTTEDRTTELEKKIDDLQEQMSDVRTQLVRATLDQWRSRVDDLDLQIHLGAMGTGDRLAPLVEQLRNRLLDANEQLSGATSTASDVASTLLNGLEQTMRDIRAAVIDAKVVATR